MLHSINQLGRSVKLAYVLRQSDGALLSFCSRTGRSGESIMRNSLSSSPWGPHCAFAATQRGLAGSIWSTAKAARSVNRLHLYTKERRWIISSSAVRLLDNGRHSKPVLVWACLILHGVFPEIFCTRCWFVSYDPRKNKSWNKAKSSALRSLQLYAIYSAGFLVTGGTEELESFPAVGSYLLSSSQIYRWRGPVRCVVTLFKLTPSSSLSCCLCSSTTFLYNFGANVGAYPLAAL